MAAASAPVKRLPRRKAARATASPSLGMQTTEIIAGTAPTRTSVKPNRASSTLTDRSIAAARPIPPATQCPAIRPT